MMRSIERKLTLVAVAVAMVAGVALSPQQMPSEQELARMMEEHARAAVPGPEHEWLESMVGSWDLEVTMWPEPGAEPMSMPTTTIESEMILGGRFLQQRGSAEMEGMSIGTMVLMGFDRRNGVYNLMAMDTTGTYWVTASGEAVDEETLVLSGSDWDGIVGHEQLYDFVLHWEDEDTLVTQVIFKDEIHTRGGPPHKMVETRATRRAN